MKKLNKIIKTIILIAALLFSGIAGAQFVQQGNKLTGTGAKVGVGDHFEALGASQGSSVSISADGSTAVVGGPNDNSYAGATWVFIRSGEVWKQQGGKLVDTAFKDSDQGSSVSISSDGNTIITGGANDNDGIGAAWIYVRKDGVWMQQGNKLVGTGAEGNNAYQGCSVAISSDGNTAVVGGKNDKGNVGAVWIFTRTNGIWSQQGNKLVGTGGEKDPQQGRSVAISSDGNTVAVGGSGVFVYSRSGGVWIQQGGNLNGTGAIGNGGNAWQGYSVAISSDGNTLIEGGINDNMNNSNTGATGAAWVFARSNGIWTQQGNKLVGTGGETDSQQGISVSVSYDGNTASVGGNNNGKGKGAIWVYTRSGGVWTQQGNKLTGSDADDNSSLGGSVSISSDGNTVIDRKSTRLNSSHANISYAVF